MNDVLLYIHDNITRRLYVNDVAGYFHYSPQYFCEKFRRFTGRTFVEYVRYYRIQLAALDILAGNHILDVAADYGYESVSGFNKAFLSEYGCLPREYKKKARLSQLYFERRKYALYHLSDRCAILRHEAVDVKSYAGRFNAQREVYFKLGAANAAQMSAPQCEIISAGIVNTIEKFTPIIFPGELIVGFNYGEEGIRIPNDSHGRKQLADNMIAPDAAEQYFNVRESYQEIYSSAATDRFTPEEMEMETEWAGIGRCVDSNHSVIAYEQVLKLGFEGLLREVDQHIALNGSTPLYESMRSICQAACTLGEKYADVARQLLEEKSETYEEEDLHRIIAVCTRVPRHPAGTFHEAVQALWFAHVLNTWEDGINANSLGRLDQILYPYYKADIDDHRITQEQAFEIICCLWIKLYRDYDVQQSCVGGTSPNGLSEVNDLSYMMLDATEQLDFIRCLSVRYSKNTEKAFLKRALEVVGHVQKGIPFFFNDDVLAPALCAKGIAPTDAWDYTQIGCVETIIPGKSNPHAVSGETNLLKALEYALMSGQSMMDPQLQPGAQTPPLCKLTTYDLFYQAVVEQIGRILELTCSKVKKSRDAAVAHNSRPYKSLLTEGCLEKARDYNDAGAKYDFYQIMLGGIPNLADSLLVIKRLVYEDKRFTLSQFRDILLQNFPDEKVRAMCIEKVPKFGNDIDEVDSIAADVTEKACDMLDALSEKFQLAFHAQPFTFLWMVEHGQHSAASPDGRRKGEIIAYSVSPMQGRDFNGLTAVLNSIAKMPTLKTPGTTSAIVEVDPKIFTDSNIDRLTDILIAASANGLCNVQFNTVNADTLIDAQKHPERHHNLAVRVSGFSQKFNLLTPELQQHIIGRTKHSCL